MVVVVVVAVDACFGLASWYKPHTRLFGFDIISCLREVLSLTISAELFVLKILKIVDDIWHFPLYDDRPGHSRGRYMR